MLKHKEHENKQKTSIPECEIGQVAYLKLFILRIVISLALTYT